MKVGAEPKKVAILAVLLLGAAWAIYTNILNPETGAPSGSSPPPSPAPVPAAATQPAVSRPQTATRSTTPSTRRTGRSSGSQEWTPSVVPRRAEDRPDPMTIDPTLQTYRLERLKTITMARGERSLFDFSQPPPPPVKQPIINPKPLATKPLDEPKPEPTKPAEPAKPPPPPIPLKFYGYVAGGGPRRGFFLQGAEEIFVAAEGELVQRRYKIVRIGVSSAVVEDTQHQHQQTLPLEIVPQQG